MKNKKRVYLACPYSHPDEKVREYRVRQADIKAAKLMEQGYRVFSPLSHSHRIAQYCKVDPCDHDFWLNQDLWVLDICDGFHVLCLEDWWKSKGVLREIKHAKAKNMPITHHKFYFGYPKA